MQIIRFIFVLLLMPVLVSAQDMYKLASKEIDEPINEFLPLSGNYKDSTYTMRILYPDYTPLKRKAARKYRKKIKREKLTLPETPAVAYSVFVDRKETVMRASFNPIVERDGKLYKVTDYVAQWTASPRNSGSSENAARSATRASAVTTDASSYSSSSLLASGTWAKIRVSETGICRLTPDVVSQAGFSDISKVKVYGYGGALVPEQLTQEWIAEHDDLPEVAVCPKDGQLYFYAYGPVSYTSNTVKTRTRNPYSDYGYYFITQTDGARKECSEQELLSSAAANGVAYHDLYENDGFAWHEMGRELVESETISAGSSKTVNLSVPENAGNVTITAILTASGVTGYTVSANDVSKSGNIRTYSSEQVAMFTTVTLECNASGTFPVTVACNSGGPIRIDYILATSENPKSYALSSALPAAEFAENVANQNHHADEVVDYVIIIPTSKKLYSQAKRLGDLHATHDGMTYRIVPANELYNEFSSGTPDVSAYRRYLKMFYDKSSDGGVKNVLLFGDCMWDNRMKTLGRDFSADDYLLVYETYNSYDKTRAVPIDDFIAILQDGMTVHADGIVQNNMQMDCGVGRIPVTSDEEAMYAVDKIVDYVEKSPSGSWQNGVTFIGDDGDENSHMRFINELADDMIARGGYNVTKIMADAYNMKKTASGNRYPVVESLIKQLQNDGQLIMNYGGHGSWTELSHERIVTLDDVKKFKGENYSMWIMAACETMPYDYSHSTLGEQLLLNKDGGAIASYGAARAVYETYNSKIDKYMMENLFVYDDNGKPLTLGEVQRRAKNQLVKAGADLTVNKHHYALLGDPAMSLAIPTYNVKVDKINDIAAGSQAIQAKALSVVTVEGHVETRDGQVATGFNGKLNSIVKDAKQTIVCRGNADTDALFQYDDYDSNIFSGTTTVTGGQFRFTFRMPKDIYDENANGLVVLYALDETGKVAANGHDTSLYPYGQEAAVNDSIGPAIHSYLNTPSFMNGGNVGRTPFFVAEINDADGINVAESSLGHYMELIVDGSAEMTYNLNNNFTFDADSYTSGSTWYVLPNLPVGKHTLTFRAWDVLNNTSQVSLDFNVVKGFEPTLTDVLATPNPAKIGENITFYVTHDLQGSEAEVNIDIIDMTGRIVGQLQWNDTFSSTKPTTSYKWAASGLSQGMYLYRVRVSCDNSKYVSKTKKLLIGY